MVSILLPPQKLEDVPGNIGLESLPPEQIQRLRKDYETLNVVLSPLTRVTSEGELQSKLETMLVPWVERVSDILQILWNSPAGRQYLDNAQHLDLETLLNHKTDPLNADEWEQMQGAFESLQGFSEWAFSKLVAGGTDAQLVNFVTGLIGHDAMRAQIVLAALFMILNEIVPDWNAESIPLLCAAADDFMTEVEDAFFGISLDGETRS